MMIPTDLCNLRRGHTFNLQGHIEVSIVPLLDVISC